MHATDNSAPPADPVAAASHPDPYGYYQRLRKLAPLYFDNGLNLWVASSHAVIAEAFESPALRVRPTSGPVPHALFGGPAGEVFASLVRMNDGAFHAMPKPPLAQCARRWTLAQGAAQGLDAVQASVNRDAALNLSTDRPALTIHSRQCPYRRGF